MLKKDIRERKVESAGTEYFENKFIQMYNAQNQFTLNTSILLYQFFEMIISIPIVVDLKKQMLQLMQTI